MRACVAALLVLTGPAAAVECADRTFEGHSLTICEVDPATEDLRLFHADATGEVFGSFARIENGLGQELSFAMNAGMYHPDRSPVGLYLENGRIKSRLVTSAGPGNFGMLPNGVFCVERGRARVIESRRYEGEGSDCRFATQSGPLLVEDNALHPRLIPDSTSRFVRNGVGTSESGDRAAFVIANEPINFHTFARVFRDLLGLPDALYFDGKVSRLHAPAMDRSDGGFPLGVIVGVVAQ